MKYSYGPWSLPFMKASRARALESAAAQLQSTLDRLDAGTLPLSAHGKKCLSIELADTYTLVRKYLHLLAWLGTGIEDLGKVVFIDYGGGHGLLGILAKMAGFAETIYTDIYQPCCDDARILSTALGSPYDQLLCGEIETVAEALTPRSLPSVALGSINVVEHIYDLPAFVRRLTTLACNEVHVFLSTSANSLNSSVCRRHYAMHRQFEHEDRLPEAGRYEADTLESYQSVREKMIREAAPALGEDEVRKLTAATRGLRRDDIVKEVRHFQSSGEIRVKPEHPTNTCDPYTGNWQERLIDVDWLRDVMETNGFEVRISGGWFDGNGRHSLKRRLKRAIAALPNLAISLGGRTGASIAPCLNICAVRRNSVPIPASSLCGVA